MDNNEWLNKKVRISLNNGLYYKGKVVDVGDDFVKIIDFRGTTVTISLNFIVVIQEWRENDQ